MQIYIRKRHVCLYCNLEFEKSALHNDRLNETKLSLINLKTYVKATATVIYVCIT